MLKKETKKRLAAQWGYVGLVVTLLLALTLFHRESGLVLIAVLLLGFLDIVFFFFQARMPCGVKNRKEGFCRNRGHGFLGGCTQVEGHRWMKLWALFKRHTYVASASVIMGKLSGKAAAVSAACTLGIMIMAVLTFVFGNATR